MYDMCEVDENLWFFLLGLFEFKLLEKGECKEFYLIFLISEFFLFFVYGFMFSFCFI